MRISVLLIVVTGAGVFSCIYIYIYMYFEQIVGIKYYHPQTSPPKKKKKKSFFFFFYKTEYSS